MKVKEVLKESNGNYLTEDFPGVHIRRYRATEAGFKKSQKEHKTASQLKVSTANHRRYSQLYSHEITNYKVLGRKGTFQDLNKRLGLGIE